jgi:glycosyltransferase involved in cell wall biosynthesis
MDATQMKISLVMPAWNEAEGIADALVEAVMALREHFSAFELLAIDDGSQDATWSEMKMVAEVYPEIQPHRHMVNQGYGAALRTGFQQAKHPLVAFTDADRQFDLTDLRRLAEATTEADVVVGYRQDRQDPWRRRFLSWGCNHLARAWLGTQVRDCDCALKVFRREALQDLIPNSRGFFVNTEMLSLAHRFRLRVLEFPVTHRPRTAGESKVSLWEIPSTLMTMFRFWRSCGRHPLPGTLQARLVATSKTTVPDRHSGIMTNS